MSKKQFKNMKVGEQFFPPGSNSLHEKIKPVESRRGFMLTEQEISTGLRSGRIKPETVVETVDA